MLNKHLPLSGYAAIVDPRVENVSPPNNTTVAEQIGPASRQFNCDTFETINEVVTRVTTAWFLRFPTNPEALIIVSPDDPEVTIGGMMRPTDVPFPTFNNLLTIVNVTSSLDGATLSCGHTVQGNNELATWTLRVYCECTLYLLKPG